jgi:nucleoside 2-deoxyribosyltransferase
MKIYFAGSISAGRHDVPLYHKIIDILKKYGLVLTEFIGDKNLSSLGEAKLSDKEIHNRDIEWLLSSDLLIAEVSTPSLGVGYEIGRALENKKKILCLYRETEGKRLSSMIKGAPLISVCLFSDEKDIENIIEEYMKEIGVHKHTGC